MKYANTSVSAHIKFVRVVLVFYNAKSLFTTMKCGILLLFSPRSHRGHVVSCYLTSALLYQDNFANDSNESKLMEQPLVWCINTVKTPKEASSHCRIWHCIVTSIG